MLGWLYSHFTTFLTYLIAPIIFHTGCDSYILLFIFTILELSDTFTGYRIYILFVFAGLLLRNYLFNYFKKSPLISKDNLNNKQSIQNNLKNLLINSLHLPKTLTSQGVRFFKNILG